jgi:hypothetical protein
MNPLQALLSLPNGTKIVGTFGKSPGDAIVLQPDKPAVAVRDFGEPSRKVCGARVELALDDLRVKLRRTVQADSPERAKDLLTRTIAPLWPGWTLTFLTPPTEVKP